MKKQNTIPKRKTSWTSGLLLLSAGLFFIACEVENDNSATCLLSDCTSYCESAGYPGENSQCNAENICICATGGNSGTQWDTSEIPTDGGDNLTDGGETLMDSGI